MKRLLFLSIILLSISSCTKGYRVSKNCSPNSPIIMETDIFINGENSKVNLDFVRSDNKSYDYEWSYGRAFVDDEIISKVILDLGIECKEKIIYIKLYFPNRDIDLGKSLDISEISGFTLFYLDKKNKAFCEIYNKELDSLGKYHIDQVSSFVGAFTMYDLLKVPYGQGTVIVFNNFASVSDIKSVWNKEESGIKKLAKAAYLRMKND